MRVPIIRWRHKGRIRFPILPDWFDQLSLFVYITRNEGVTPWLTVENQIESNGIVTVRRLHGTNRKQSEHCPKRVSDGERLRKILIGEQHRNSISVDSIWVCGHLLQFALAVCRFIKCGRE